MSFKKTDQSQKETCRRVGTASQDYWKKKITYTASGKRRELVASIRAVNLLDCCDGNHKERTIDLITSHAGFVPGAGSWLGTTGPVSWLKANTQIFIRFWIECPGVLVKHIGTKESK